MSTMSISKKIISCCLAVLLAASCVLARPTIAKANPIAGLPAAKELVIATCAAVFGGVAVSGAYSAFDNPASADPMTDLWDEFCATFENDQMIKAANDLIDAAASAGYIALNTLSVDAQNCFYAFRTFLISKEATTINVNGVDYTFTVQEQTLMNDTVSYLPSSGLFLNGLAPTFQNAWQDWGISVAQTMPLAIDPFRPIFYGAPYSDLTFTTTDGETINLSHKLVIPYGYDGSTTESAGRWLGYLSDDARNVIINDLDASIFSYDLMGSYKDYPYALARWYYGGDPSYGYGATYYLPYTDKVFSDNSTFNFSNASVIAFISDGYVTDLYDISNNEFYKLREGATTDNPDVISPGLSSWEDTNTEVLGNQWIGADTPISADGTTLGLDGDLGSIDIIRQPWAITDWNDALNQSAAGVSAGTAAGDAVSVDSNVIAGTAEGVQDVPLDDAWGSETITGGSTSDSSIGRKFDWSWFLAPELYLIFPFCLPWDVEHFFEKMDAWSNDELQTSLTVPLKDFGIPGLENMVFDLSMLKDFGGYTRPIINVFVVLGGVFLAARFTHKFQ